MKELYISPELEILCFEAMEQIANVWGGSYNTYRGGIGNALDSENERPGDIVEDEENMDPLH